MKVPEPTNGVTGNAMERRREPRFDGELRATFTMTDDGGVWVFPCVIESISASAMRIRTEGPLSLSQSIWVDVEGFGPVRANVDNVRADGFICYNVLNDQARRRLGVWVAWMARRAGRLQDDKRAHARIKPRDGRTTVAFENGEVIPVLLRDISRSGVAVDTGRAAIRGELVMVGRVLGRVVRLFPGGFAVAFSRILEEAEADKLVSGYQVKSLPEDKAG